MKFFMILAICGCLQTATAQSDTVKTNADMHEATVYFGYGAELTHHAKLHVAKNTKYIVIDKLSTQMDINSLQINCPESMSLLSQQFSIYNPPVKPKQETAMSKRIRDTIKMTGRSIAAIENKIQIAETILEKTDKLIDLSIATSGNKTSLTAEVIKIIEYYDAIIEKNKKAIFDLQTEEGIFQEKLGELNNRLTLYFIDNAAQDKEMIKPYGRILLQVVTRLDLDADIAISYYTNNAGWQPVYDIRVTSKTNKIKLVYKASVTQKTGIDWAATKLTLSTGTPNFTTNAPLFNPWYLQLYVPQLYNTLQGRAAGAVVNGYGSNSYNSYDDKGIAEKLVNDGERFKIQNDMVNPSTLDQYTNMKQGLLNTNFEIELPYDIESNGLSHSINIKEQELQSNLKNYAVPKLDGDAYLLAELTDWQNLDLIPGNANIIMDNTYIGRSFIDPNTTADTLNLSLGKDKRVAVKRTLVKDASSSRTKDSYTKQTFTYELVVKNNKITDVNMLLKDQYPLSNIKEVEVELLDEGGASVNKELGVLNWKIDLKPGEVKKFRFSYSIKYPKDKKIINIK